MCSVEIPNGAFQPIGEEFTGVVRAVFREQGGHEGECCEMYHGVVVVGWWVAQRSDFDQAVEEGYERFGVRQRVELRSPRFLLLVQKVGEVDDVECDVRESGVNNVMELGFGEGGIARDGVRGCYYCVAAEQSREPGL